MKKIIFRADGNGQIGLGHVMRCLALSQMLGPAYNRRFAISQPTSEVVNLIDAQEMAVIALETNEVAEFLTCIQPEDVVVLDGYSFPEAYQVVVRNRARKLVFIDDLVAGHQVADVVINHAGGVEATDYQSESYTEFCLGPQYAMLRPEFLQPGGFFTRPMGGAVFVCLGGADPKNLTSLVVSALRFENYAIRVVIGSAFAYKQNLFRLSDSIPNIKILENLSAPELVVEIEKSNLAIVSCSTVAYEICAVNRPFICIKTADNQAKLYQFFEQEKLATMLFDLRFHADTFAFYVNNIYNHSAENILARQRRFFDGQSPERFRQLFARLCS
jgi:UDP-2,4-diacetamido-2,4,6-trideoxy-beta-L-altropyranose hydrolase